MSTPGIELRLHEDVTYVTLARRDKANALDAAMLRALCQVFAQARPGGLVVLRSAMPGLFCAGADIAEFLQGGLHAQGEALQSLMTAMDACPASILAIAGGRAAGAGFILLALADVVIASGDAVMAAPEIAFGMYPVLVQAALEPKIGGARARQLCLSGQALAADEARMLGLATDVLAGDDFASRAEARLSFYLARRAALGTARRARGLPQVPLAARIAALVPLMHANFEQGGVRERISTYLAQLRARRQAE